ncbi:hypothetical protein OH76DRAFT_1412278 [Lentinus brumalis]|uniref:Uncharacterized protein n=1 Tax=Lentinus brumalis TaxID=2498619 RepID=A0A371CLV1_9APHY|nr:hypothetical protein OH76DRAFT_1412278 [Polyporus brumalis]
MSSSGSRDSPSTPPRILHHLDPGIFQPPCGPTDDESTPKPPRLFSGAFVESDSDDEKTPKPRKISIADRYSAAGKPASIRWNESPRAHTTGQAKAEPEPAKLDPISPPADGDSEKVRGWKETYKTAADLFLKSTMPRMPPVYDQSRLTNTKEMTKPEFYIPLQDCLRYIVYWPNLLDKAIQEAIRLLSALKLDWNNPEHIIFAAYCLPDMFGPLLPEKINSETDVVSWSDGGISRPALVAFRACTLLPFPRISIFGGLKVPRLTSAPAGEINPDRLIVREVEILDAAVALAREQAEKAERKLAEDERKADLESMGYEVERVRPKAKKTTKTRGKTTSTRSVNAGTTTSTRQANPGTTRQANAESTGNETKTKRAKKPSGVHKKDDKVAKPIPLLTIEAKTHRVWSDKCFASIFEMPIDSGVEAHPMRFAWPKTINDQANSETRVIIQVWGQMTYYKVNYAILSCYESSVFLMREGDTLYVSRKYSYEENPQLKALAHFLLAAGKVPDTKLPNLDDEMKFMDKVYSWAKLEAQEIIGIVTETTWAARHADSRTGSRARAASTTRS